MKGGSSAPLFSWSVLFFGRFPSWKKAFFVFLPHENEEFKKKSNKDCRVWRSSWAFRGGGSLAQGGFARKLDSPVLLLARPAFHSGQHSRHHPGGTDVRHQFVGHDTACALRLPAFPGGFRCLVPFHLWTADVYQGAPTTVSAYLSVISKGAAAVALGGILYHVFAPLAREWSYALSLLVMITITIGNLMALLQNNMKRFMSFSSISQAGYLLLGVLAGSAQGMASVVFYLVIYVAANVGVFAVIGAIEEESDGRLVNRDDYRGLYRTNPRLAFLMTLCLFSLAGIPPFAGFFSKFFIFSSAFHSGWWATVFVALVNTVISLYYYLLVVKAMYIEEPEGGVPAVQYFRVGGTSRICMWLCFAGVCVLGLLSVIYEGLFNWATVFCAG